MKQEREVTIEKDDGIFSTLVIKYPSESTSIFCGMNMIIHEVTREYSIDPANISSINITREGCIRKIKIKYSKFDLSSITSIDDREEQIIAILNLLSYSQDKIKDISQEEKWPSISGSTETIWVARLDEHYDPDEGFSQRDHEFSMSRKISKALGFEVKVSMC